MKKVTSKIDESHDTRHFINSKEQEIKNNVYLLMFDKMYLNQNELTL